VVWKQERLKEKGTKMSKQTIGKEVLIAAIGAFAILVAGCDNDEPKTHAELMKKYWDVPTKAKVEKMKAEAEAQRRAREEMYTKTIGGAMVKRTMETASGTAKKDKEADDRVRRALDRDFGAPQPASKPTQKPSPASQKADK
jgi:antirestriction protein ArdC